MAYTIYNNDGTILLTLADAEIDSITTSLDLIGKNVNNYGQYVNNNLIKLLTSFASSPVNMPLNPQVGQLWFNTTDKRLTVFDGIEFNPTYGSHVDGTQPATTSTGDFWYDTVNSQLNIWNGSQYKLIAPAVSGVLGKFGIEPPTTSTIKTADTNLPQKVSIINSYGNATAFITTAAFTMSTASSVTFLGVGQASNVVAGYTIFQDLHVRGDLHLDGIFRTPAYSLSSAYDITGFGDYTTGTTATIQGIIDAANIAIRNDLIKLFPSEVDNGSYNQHGFPETSEARVLCNYNTSTSVRRFILSHDLVHDVSIWAPYNLYTSTYITNTLTNIVI